MDKQILINKLRPYAQGCFSGDVSEWPQLKPLLQDIYKYLCDINISQQAPCTWPCTHMVPHNGMNFCPFCGRDLRVK